jgi:hypothetical protein
MTSKSRSRDPAPACRSTSLSSARSRRSSAPLLLLFRPNHFRAPVPTPDWTRETTALASRTSRPTASASALRSASASFLAASALCCSSFCRRRCSSLDGALRPPASPRPAPARRLAWTSSYLLASSAASSALLRSSASALAFRSCSYLVGPRAGTLGKIPWSEVARRA